MPKFEEGHEKKGGRKKGTPNKSTGFKRLLREVIQENEQEFKEIILGMLRDKNDRKYVIDLLCQLEPKEFDPGGLKRLEIEYVE